MRIEEKEIVIDNIPIIDKTYISDDGKTFHFASSCIKHEKKLAIQHIPLKKVSYMGYEDWYYISSVEDFYALKDYIAVVVQGGTRTDFDVYNLKNRFINDWVSYQIEHDDDNADSSDSCDFTSFKETQKNFEEIQKDFNELGKTLNISET